MCDGKNYNVISLLFLWLSRVLHLFLFLGAVYSCTQQLVVAEAVV